MTITWETSGYPRSKTRRYTQVTPGFEGGEWATDQLSLVYDRIHQGMDADRSRAHDAVQARSRVDTGLMRASVVSSIITEGERIETSYGWFYDYPHYAKYQEFGTVHISAMKAVHSTFWESHDNLRALIGA